MDASTIQELLDLAARSRVFVSMPYLEGLTPGIFNEEGRYEVVESGEVIERRHGIFKLDEAALSPLDHGGLYGDAVFEGILIVNDQVFLFKEHLSRWWRSAEKLAIGMPYTMDDLAWKIVEAIQAVGFKAGEKGYLRPVLTRGVGNLGINPAKCVSPTIYCIASTIQLYPRKAYETGIELSIAKHVRRPSREILDPNIKDNNYLNNIRGLLETRAKGRLETLMLTSGAAVAEATADNIFCVVRGQGYEDDPSAVEVITPSPEYCLIGLTRNLIMREARSLGYKVVESDSMLPIEFIGPDRECFMTGTGCGLMPVVGIEGNVIGAGRPGPVTRKLLERVNAAMSDPGHGLSIHTDRAGVIEYLKREPVVEVLPN